MEVRLWTPAGDTVNQDTVDGNCGMECKGFLGERKENKHTFLYGGFLRFAGNEL